MQLLSFEGGLNTRVEAHLIGPTEARVFSNIDSDSAVLKPIKGNTDTGTAVARYAYYSTIDDTWYSAATPTDWLEYKETLYKGNRIDAPVKIIGGVEYQLGITAPTGTVSLTSVNSPEAIARLEMVSAITGGDLPSGAYKYKLVNKSTTTGKVSRSYHATPVELSTVAPATLSSTLTALTRTNSVLPGTKFTNFVSGSVLTGSDTLELTVTDTNADLVRIYRHYDGAWRALTADFQSPATTVVDDTYDISANDELIESSAVNGTIQYAITFYNSSTGAESAPLLTDEVVVLNGDVQITSIPVSSDPQVDKVRLYRIGGDVTAFTLVTTLSNGTTSFTDTLADTELVGTLLTSTDNDPAPAGLKYLTEAYAMLFGALGDKLRFTPIGKPDAWPTNYFLDFPETITGISKTAIGLLIHTLYQTYLVTGTGPTAFAQQTLAGDQGCVSHDTIRETKDTAMWVSTDGVCASDGSDVKVISRGKLGKLNIDPVNAILYDQVYQVLQTDGSVLAVDFDRGIFKSFAYDVDYLVVADDVLYGHKAGSLYSISSGETNATFNYTSPDFMGNGLTEQKVYSDIRMHSLGTITINVLVDSTVVATFTETGTGLKEFKIPQSKLRGTYISFQISGTGTVRSLAWKEASANG